MAEFVFIPEQTIQPGQNAILDTAIGSRSGNILHRNGSGIVILRGAVSNPYSNFARYQVVFNGNIALPEVATVGPISVALAIDGEPLQSSKAIVTPAAVEEFFNVTSTAIITVPRGCCLTVAVENTSAAPVAAEAQTAAVAPAILLANANMTVERIA